MKHKGGIAAGMLAAVGVVAAALTMKSSSAPPKVDEGPSEEAAAEAPASITETASSVAVVKADGEMTDAAATGSGDESGAAAAPVNVLNMATEQPLEVSANAGVPFSASLPGGPFNTATPEMRNPYKSPGRVQDSPEQKIRLGVKAGYKPVVRQLPMTTDGATPAGLPEGAGQNITTRR